MSRRSLPFVVLAVILALVGVAAVLALRQYDANRDAATNELRARVGVAAATADAYFAGDVSTLDAIAAADPVVQGDEQRMLTYFRRVAPPGNKVFSGGVAWIDPTGHSRVSSSLTRIGAPVDTSDRTYFKVAISTNRPYISEGLTSRRTRFRIVVVAVPTHGPTGKVNGVLAEAIKVVPTPAGQSTVDLGLAGLDDAPGHVVVWASSPKAG